MIRIEISAPAYRALAAAIPAESLLEPLPSPSGGFYLWLAKQLADKLRAARGPGESYSDMILRWAADE